MESRIRSFPTLFRPTESIERYSPENTGAADQYKQGANLLVNTMIDSFFGSVFNNLSELDFTQIGSSERCTFGLQQPLGDNESVGLAQGKEGNIETKSKELRTEI